MADSFPPVPPPPAPSAQAPTSGLAITSLVLGILSVTAAGCFTGLPAIICGHMARGAIARSNNSVQGAGMALAGLILGYLSVVVTILVVVLIFGGAILVGVSEANASKAANDVKAIATISSLRMSVDLYKSNSGAYPTTAQGLQALTTRPTVDPIPKEWEEVLPQVPVDPWGNPYVYESPGSKNADSYDIFSAGPDGEPNTGDDIWPK